MLNEDIRANGGCLFPARAQCAVYREEPRHYTITGAALDSDSEILSEARKLTDVVTEPRTSVIDYRESPPRSSYVDERGIGPLEKLNLKEDSKPASSSLYIIALLNAVVLFILLAVIAFKWLRRT